MVATARCFSFSREREKARGRESAANIVEKSMTATRTVSHTSCFLDDDDYDVEDVKYKIDRERRRTKKIVFGKKLIVQVPCL